MAKKQATKKTVAKPSKTSVVKASIVDRGLTSELKAFNFFDAAYPSPSNLENWGHLYPEKMEDVTDPQSLLQLRIESLCEVLNDDALNGMVNVAAESIIGTGAMTRVVIDDEPDKHNKLAQYIETIWQEWCDSVKYASKLRTAEKDLQQFGTYYRRLVYNPQKPFGLDVVLVSPMRVANPDAIINGDYTTLFGEHVRVFNGIAFDIYGNELFYCVLRKSPMSRYYESNEFDWFSAETMSHIFDPQFSEQIDGYPMTAPSLEKGVLRRRYEKQELTASLLESTLNGYITTSADYKAVIGTLPLEQQNQVYDLLMQTCKEVGNALQFPVSNFLNLPPLTEMRAFDAQHPHAGFAQHRLESLKGQGRSLRMPEFVATGSAANYNYASVQKDSQWWNQHREIFRQDIELSDLRPAFQLWLQRAMIFDPKLKPLLSGKIKKVKPQFYWKQEEHADPVKQASSLLDLMRGGVLSVSDLMMAFGKDPEAQKTKIKRELDEMKGYMIFDNGMGAPLPDPIQLAEKQAAAKQANNPNNNSNAKSKPKPKSKTKPKK